MAALHLGDHAEILSMSSGSAGAGSCADNSVLGQVFVASERKSILGTTEEVPGTAALNPRGHSGITSVSYHQGPGIGRPGEGSETG